MLESLHRCFTLYLWLSFRFPLAFCYRRRWIGGRKRSKRRLISSCKGFGLDAPNVYRRWEGHRQHREKRQGEKWKRLRRSSLKSCDELATYQILTRYTTTSYTTLRKTFINELRSSVMRSWSIVLGYTEAQPRTMERSLRTDLASEISVGLSSLCFRDGAFRQAFARCSHIRSMRCQ